MIANSDLNITSNSVGRGGKRPGSGRKKLDPEDKILSVKKALKKYKSKKRIWQAQTDDVVMERSEKLMKQLGIRHKHDFLEWLLERGERSLARKGIDLD